MNGQAVRVQQAAMECVGTPFEYRGRLRGVGLDCVGLIDYCRVASGWDPAPVPIYGHPPPVGMLLDGFARYLHRCEPLAEPGRVCAFWTRRPGRVRHTGIVISRGNGLELVEAHSQRGKVTVEAITPARLRCLDSAWEIPMRLQ